MTDPTFLEELTALINKHNLENGSNTPDYILADYLNHCLAIFDSTVKERSRWYGENPKNLPPIAPPIEPCLWTVDDEGTWSTECGNAFQFEVDGPHENNARFCQYCGHPIDAVHANH